MRNTKYVAEERYTENKLKQEFMQSIRRMIGCGLGELGFTAYEKVQFDAGCGAFCTRARVCVVLVALLHGFFGLVVSVYVSEFFARQSSSLSRLPNLHCNRSIAGYKQRLSHIKSR